MINGKTEHPYSDAAEYTAPSCIRMPLDRETEDQLREDNENLKKQIDEIRGIALRDQLTGLYSRHYLTDYLEQEIIRSADDASVVLALCDIDDFKTINDTRGHYFGDIALACIADILDDLAGGNPVIRWGGEELLVVLFDTSDTEALRLCDQMRSEVAAYSIEDGTGGFTCTITFGLGVYDPSLSFDRNFTSVDRALYRGKETGKNCCVFVSTGIDTEIAPEEAD